MFKPETINPVEWQARCELAALYRLVAHSKGARAIIVDGVVTDILELRAAGLLERMKNGEPVEQVLRLLT
jgi:hypothetical protein